MGRSRVWFGIFAVALMLLAEGAPVAAQGRGRGHNKAFRIPPGHMPAPGQCRVWYQGVPPGHQPPAVPCRALRGYRFPGAVVVTTPVHRDRHRVEYWDVVRDDRRYRDDRWYRDDRRREVVRRVDARERVVDLDGWVELRFLLGF